MQRMLANVVSRLLAPCRLRVPARRSARSPHRSWPHAKLFRVRRCGGRRLSGLRGPFPGCLLRTLPERRAIRQFVQIRFHAGRLAVEEPAYGIGKARMREPMR